MSIYRKTDLPIEYLRSRLHYDPETDTLIWKERPIRPEYSRTDKSWNGRYAGTTADYRMKDGRGQISIDNKKYYLHRIKWALVYGEWPKEEIDHITGLENSDHISNYREATHAENQQNKRAITKRNTSGYAGASWHEKDKKWRARFRDKFLGNFDTKEQAHAAYLDAKSKYHTFQPTPR